MAIPSEGDGLTSGNVNTQKMYMAAKLSVQMRRLFKQWNAKTLTLDELEEKSQKWFMNPERREGFLIIATGFPGSGKTFTCEELCAWVLLNRGFVISNVKLLKWDEERDRPVEGEYPNYLLVGSFVATLDAIAEILRFNRGAHILLYI